jgi:Zn-dependent protease with chaperone function
VFCQQCGEQIGAQAKFCWSCGRKVEAATAAPPATPPTADDAVTAAADATPALAGPAPAAPGPKRVYPVYLDVARYEHPDDRRATDHIRMLAPVVAVARALIAYLGEPMVSAQLLGHAVKVGPNQFPRLHALTAECSRVLHMAAPDVYVRQSPTFNAMTMGVDRPFVVLFSSLVDAFSDDELRYIIGHELGHIKSQHALYLTAFHLLTTQMARLAQRFGLGSVILIPARLALESWARTAELTADRAGLICCQDMRITARSLVKLIVGSEQLAAQMNIDEFLRQDDNRSTFRTVQEATESHPVAARRIRQLTEFAESGAYKAILASGADNITISPEEREHFAAEILQRALAQINPGALASLVGAMSRDRGGGLRKGLGDLNNILNLYPGTVAAVEAEFYVGFVAMHLRKGAEAVTRFERFVAAHPEHELVPHALFHLGSCHLWLMRDREAARREFGRLAAEYPKSPAARDAREILAELPR